MKITDVDWEYCYPILSLKAFVEALDRCSEKRKLKRSLIVIEPLNYSYIVSWSSHDWGGELIISMLHDLYEKVLKEDCKGAMLMRVVGYGDWTLVHAILVKMCNKTFLRRVMKFSTPLEDETIKAIFQSLRGGK